MNKVGGSKFPISASGWVGPRCGAVRRGATFGVFISCLCTYLNVSNSQMIMSEKYTFFLCVFAFDIIVPTAVAILVSITGY